METTPFRFGLETLLEQPPLTACYRRCPKSDISIESAVLSSESMLPGESTGFSLGSTISATELPSLLSGKRIAILSHPAGVDGDLIPSVERVGAWLGGDTSSGGSIGKPREIRPEGARLTTLFGPQHGIRGEKQDNMVESEDETDSRTGLPTFSLYGTTRRITPGMAETFDVLLVDLQDVGVRVYTFLTTLAYILEDLSRYPEKEVWVLDRPNPTGRLIEGLALEPGHESFVGAAPIPMQHGITLGEFALWYHSFHRLSSRLVVVPMTGWNPYNPAEAWPSDRVWVQPSPNMPGLYTARAYPGTVILEGTTLSEGRGTTRPLSVLGHPAVEWDVVLSWAAANTGDPGALVGCKVREITFQPTFHKHAGIPTGGIEIVTEGKFYDPELFRPYRLVTTILKAIRTRHPDITLWTEPPYEYEFERTPIDVITGGTRYRKWIEDDSADWNSIDEVMTKEENEWRRESRRWWIY